MDQTGYRANPVSVVAHAPHRTNPDARQRPSCLTAPVLSLSSFIYPRGPLLSSPHSYTYSRPPNRKQVDLFPPRGKNNSRLADLSNICTLLGIYDSIDHPTLIRHGFQLHLAPAHCAGRLHHHRARSDSVRYVIFLLLHRSHPSHPATTNLPVATVISS